MFPHGPRLRRARSRKKLFLLLLPLLLFSLSFALKSNFWIKPQNVESSKEWHELVRGGNDELVWGRDEFMEPNVGSAREREESVDDPRESVQSKESVQNVESSKKWHGLIRGRDDELVRRKDEFMEPNVGSAREREELVDDSREPVQSKESVRNKESVQEWHETFDGVTEQDVEWAQEREELVRGRDELMKQNMELAQERHGTVDKLIEPIENVDSIQESMFLGKIEKNGLVRGSNHEAQSVHESKEWSFGSINFTETHRLVRERNEEVQSVQENKELLLGGNKFFDSIQAVHERNEFCVSLNGRNEWERQFLKESEWVLTRMDESIRVGLGVDVVVKEGCDARLSLHNHTDFKGEIGNEMALYTMLRKDMMDSIRRRRPKSEVKIAVFIVWAGTKPPPEHVAKVATMFARSDERVIPMIFIEGEFGEQVRRQIKAQIEKDDLSNAVLNRIRVIDEYPNDKYDETITGNLTRFIHTRADELIPGIRGHYHYALGWSLCDFRWMFGNLFSQWIPETQFTHWAWGDADSYVGRIFGPITDFGNDFKRHDVVTFSDLIFNENARQTSVMGYTSGSFTVIKNTRKGRLLYTKTPSVILERALRKDSNSLLDEVGTSNAVLSSKGVTVALISSQIRNEDTVFDKHTGALLYVGKTAATQRAAWWLWGLGRVDQGQTVTALGECKVIGRFTGGKPLDDQMQTKATEHNVPQAKWYVPSFIPITQYANLNSPGTGFGSLLKDARGIWWHRPHAMELYHNTSTNMFIGEIAVVHSRTGGPCDVANAQDDLRPCVSGYSRTL